MFNEEPSLNIVSPYQSNVFIEDVTMVVIFVKYFFYTKNLFKHSLSFNKC